MQRTKTNNSGSSLIEIIIYFTILAIFLAVAITFAFQITGLTAVSEEVQEFQANKEFIADKIKTSIYTSSGIDETSSVFDNDNGILSLSMNDVSKSPTKFYIEDGNIFIKEGSADPIQINTNDTKIEKANFHRVTYQKSPDQIIATIQIAPVAAEAANLQRTSTINLTLSLRTL